MKLRINEAVFKTDRIYTAVSKELNTIYIVGGKKVTLFQLIEDGHFGGKADTITRKRGGGAKKVVFLFTTFSNNLYSGTITVSKSLYEAVYAEHETTGIDANGGTYILFSEKQDQPSVPPPTESTTIYEQGQIWDKYDEGIYVLTEANGNYSKAVIRAYDNNGSPIDGSSESYDTKMQLEGFELKGQLKVGQYYKNKKGAIFKMVQIDYTKNTVQFDVSSFTITVQQMAENIVNSSLTLVDGEIPRVDKKIKFVKFVVDFTESPFVEKGFTVNTWSKFQAVLELAGRPKESDGFAYYKTDISLTDELGNEHIVPRFNLSVKEKESIGKWRMNGHFDPLTEAIHEAMPYLMSDEPNKFMEKYLFGDTENEAPKPQANTKLKNDSLHLALLDDRAVKIEELPTDLADEIREYNELDKAIKAALKEGDISESAQWIPVSHYSASLVSSAERSLLKALFNDPFVTNDPPDWIKLKKIFAKDTKNLFGAPQYYIWGFEGATRKEYSVNEYAYNCIVAPSIKDVPSDYEPPILSSDENYALKLQQIDDMLTLKVWAFIRGLEPVKKEPEPIVEPVVQPNLDDFKKCQLILNSEPSERVQEFIEKWSFVGSDKRYITFLPSDEIRGFDFDFERIEDERCVIVLNKGLKFEIAEMQNYLEIQKINIEIQNS